MSAMEGMMGSFSLGGSAIALMTGVSLDWNKSVTEMAYLGDTTVKDVMQGVKKYKGTANKAYVDNTYLKVFMAGTELVGTILPRGGTTPYIAGTIVITGGRLSGIEKDSEAPVIEDASFVMYNITVS